MGGSRDMPGGDNPVPDDLSGGSYGKKFKEDARRYYGSEVSFAARGEMIPNEDCYCDLDPERKRPIRHSRPPLPLEMELARIEPVPAREENLRRADRSDGRHAEPNGCHARKQSIERPGWIIHEVGGAIIGGDAKKSVVNQWNQTWDVKNLFLCDGAPFASNADKNPTLTIMALSWRAAITSSKRRRKGNL